MARRESDPLSLKSSRDTDLFLSDVLSFDSNSIPTAIRSIQ